MRGIDAKGAQFDPHKHQAVMEQEDASVASGTVLQVFQEGYEIGERVLRPSMVVVSKGGAKPVKAGEAEPKAAPAAANDAGQAAGSDEKPADPDQSTDESQNS